MDDVSRLAAGWSAGAAIELSRRELLRVMAAGAAVALLPVRRVAAAYDAALPIPGFLTTDETAILEAAVARIVPTDPLVPGARECRAADYIRGFLNLMPGSDANCDRRVNAADMTATVLAAGAHRPGCPLGGDVDGNGAVDATDAVGAEGAVFGAQPVYAGGPFSDRQPQAHFATGLPCYVCHVAPLQEQPVATGSGAAATVDKYPPNFFTQSLQPSRLQALSWKIRILGAAAVPEVADNPLARELPEVNLREKYRTNLAALESASQKKFMKPFVKLAPKEQTTVINEADRDFVTLLTAHTIEGILCAPEYGGNRNRLGWQLVGFDGDSQPLGYEIYDETLPGNYRERPDKPNSGPNPDEDCSGFSIGVVRFLNIISSVDLTRPNRRFPSPYCLDVPTHT